MMNGDGRHAWKRRSVRPPRASPIPSGLFAREQPAERPAGCSRARQRPRGLSGAGLAAAVHGGEDGGGFVNQMRRGRLPRTACRHVRVDCPEDRAASTLSQAGSPHQTPCRRAGANPRVAHRSKLGARAHTIRLDDRTHCRPSAGSTPTTPGPPRLTQEPCTGEEVGIDRSSSGQVARRCELAVAGRVSA
jgi:hypothetical protein